MQAAVLPQADSLRWLGVVVGEGQERRPCFGDSSAADWEPSERTSVSLRRGGRRGGADPEPAIVYVCHQNFSHVNAGRPSVDSHPAPPVTENASVGPRDNPSGPAPRFFFVFFDGSVLKARWLLTRTPVRPLAAELPLWQIDICNLREAVTQHPPDGERGGGTQSIQHGLF